MKARQTFLTNGVRAAGLALVVSVVLLGHAALTEAPTVKDNLATADLMERFYRARLVDQLSPPAALRQAQRQMAASERWRDPYFWAGFAVQGEWRRPAN
jgi:CHAT domain